VGSDQSFSVGPDTTQLIVSESSSSAQYGQESSVIFTAKITTGNDAAWEIIPNGEDATINVGSTSCQATTSSGSASCSIGDTDLDVSGTPYAISATYAGDSNLNDSTSTNTLNFTVVQATQTIAITPNPDSTVYSPGGTYQINASTNGDGTLGYTQISGSCSVDSSGLITITGAGSCNVSVTATGGTNYANTTPINFVLYVPSFSGSTTFTPTAGVPFSEPISTVGCPPSGTPLGVCSIITTTSVPSWASFTSGTLSGTVPVADANELFSIGFVLSLNGFQMSAETVTIDAKVQASPPTTTTPGSTTTTTPGVTVKPPSGVTVKPPSGVAASEYTLSSKLAGPASFTKLVLQIAYSKIEPVKFAIVSKKRVVSSISRTFAVEFQRGKVLSSGVITFGIRREVVATLVFKNGRFITVKRAKYVGGIHVQNAKQKLSLALRVLSVNLVGKKVTGIASVLSAGKFVTYRFTISPPAK
jgi:hypothetical protein